MKFVLLAVLLMSYPTQQEVRTDPVYRPKPCGVTVCVLTGPGGFVREWDLWAYQGFLSGKRFVVRGDCISACERAYRIVKRLGAPVQVLPGARLIYHAPKRVK